MINILPTPGYIISFITLVFVALCEVAWHVFSAQTAYSVNLAAVSLVAIGCTVQQSSFYGFAALLPKKKYTQALMTGESIAGFLVSTNRVATKLLIQSDKISTVIFFLTSTVYIAFSYILHVITIDSPFIRYHLKSCTKIVLRPDEVNQIGIKILSSVIQLNFRNLTARLSMAFSTSTRHPTQLNQHSALATQSMNYQTPPMGAKATSSPH